MPPISCFRGSHPFSVGFLHLALWANPFGLSILVKCAPVSLMFTLLNSDILPLSLPPLSPQAFISSPPPRHQKVLKLIRVKLAHGLICLERLPGLYLQLLSCLMKLPYLVVLNLYFSSMFDVKNFFSQMKKPSPSCGTDGIN